MNLKFKKYRLFKTKKIMKQPALICLYYLPQGKASSWVSNEQKLNQNGLTYYKFLNSFALRTLKSSIYSNFSNFFHGSIVSLKASKSANEFSFKSFYSETKHFCI